MLGKICVTITDAGNAVAANGLNLQLDAQEIADLKAIAVYLQGATKSTVISLPELAAAKV